jgi:hypothetical protein
MLPWPAGLRNRQQAKCSTTTLRSPYMAGTTDFTIDCPCRNNCDVITLLELLGGSLGYLHAKWRTGLSPCSPDLKKRVELAVISVPEQDTAREDVGWLAAALIQHSALCPAEDPCPMIACLVDPCSLESTCPGQICTPGRCPCTYQCVSRDLYCAHMPQL